MRNRWRILPLAIIALLATSALLFAQDAAPSGDTNGASGSTTSLFEAFFIQRNERTGSLELLGTGIVWFLLALSVASLALIGSQSQANRKERLLPLPLAKELKGLLKRGDAREAQKRAADDGSFLGQIFAAALRERTAGDDAMRMALERAAEERVMDRLRAVETLGIIGAVSPMIGLFGTVYGMIVAFREIVATGGSPDPVGLAAGIGAALTTTFWGLVVAIPALAAHALLRNRIDRITSEAALIAEELILQYSPRDAADARTDDAGDDPLALEKSA